MNKQAMTRFIDSSASETYHIARLTGRDERRHIHMIRTLLVLSCLASLHAQVSPQELIEKGHFKRARALADERYRANPKDPETLWLMSDVKQSWHDLSAAVDFAEKAVAADPKNSRYHLQLAEAAGDEAEKASIFRQLGLARRLKKEVDAALALDPANVQALDFLMEYQLQAPSIVGGDKTAARAVPDRIMKIDPVEGYFAQVRLAQFDKQGNRIEELLRKAVEARPSSFDAHAHLGSFCASGNVKKYEEAESHGREAIRIDPGRVGGHSLLAVALVRQSKWAELDKALTAAEKVVPDNLMPYYRAAANCLDMNAELPRAEQYIRRYLGQEPEPNAASHAEAHWRLGRVLEKQGRKADAVAEYRTALKMDPDSPAKQDLKRIQ